MRSILLLVTLALAGCIDDGETYQVSGSFTEDRADADILALTDKAEALGGTVAIMESFPEQFSITFGVKGDCESMHKWLDAQPFVASATSCRTLAAV